MQYPTKEQSATMFNAWKQGGKEGLKQALQEARRLRHEMEADKTQENSTLNGWLMAEQKKPVHKGTQIAEPYPTDDQIETLFNAWNSEGKAGLGKALDSLHPEGWAILRDEGPE